MMEIYLVGGAVRDELLGLPVKEKDWLVVGATPAQMISEGFRPVGKDFPVFLHPETHEEYALARTERKTAPGYQGFTFHTDDTVTLEQDLLRRDLTINTMVRNAAGELLDPLNAQQDIDQRCLRHVSDAFAEDPVRILRIARFLARFSQLGFCIAASTMALMQSMVAAGETQYLVAERVWQECDKALGEQNPECFLHVLQASGVIADVMMEFDEVSVLKACENLIAVSQQIESRPLRFSAMVFDLEPVQIKSLCERLAVPNMYRELAVLLNQYGEQLMNAQLLDAKNIVKVIQGVDAHRKKERFSLMLTGLNTLLSQQKNDDINVFWRRVVNVYADVDPQIFIARGLQKAALGQAIAQQRLSNIQTVLDR